MPVDSSRRTAFLNAAFTIIAFMDLRSSYSVSGLTLFFLTPARVLTSLSYCLPHLG